MNERTCVRRRFVPSLDGLENRKLLSDVTPTSVVTDPLPAPTPPPDYTAYDSFGHAYGDPLYTVAIITPTQNLNEDGVPFVQYNGFTSYDYPQLVSPPTTDASTTATLVQDQTTPAPTPTPPPGYTAYDSFGHAYGDPLYTVAIPTPTQNLNEDGEGLVAQYTWGNLYGSTGSSVAQPAPWGGGDEG